MLRKKNRFQNATKILPSDRNPITLVLGNILEEYLERSSAPAPVRMLETSAVLLESGSETGLESMRRPPGIEGSSAQTVKILSVSPSDADHAALRQILQPAETTPEMNCRWMVHPVSTAASTAEVLAQEEIPIVISECNLSSGTWQTILEVISPLAQPPLLIVASRVADERLWAEALNLGAWDVLAKPFDSQEVIRVLDWAWRHWNDRPELSAEQKFPQREHDRGRQEDANGRNYSQR
jgi:CheY-like chemotaxis protein